MVNILDCRSGDKGSIPFEFELGELTQLVECLLCKQDVKSSSLLFSKFNDCYNSMHASAVMVRSG